MSAENFASRFWTAGAPEVCGRRTLTSDGGDAGCQVCEEKARTGQRFQVYVWNSKEIDSEYRECWFRGRDLAVRRRR